MFVGPRAKSIAFCLGQWGVGESAPSTERDISLNGSLKNGEGQMAKQQVGDDDWEAF